MPTLFATGSFKITIYRDDHNPPHFHILSADEEAQVSIETLELLRGSIRRKTLRAALVWARDNQDVLRAQWNEFNGVA